MDVLSEVLKTVKLDGAVFYNAEFSAPWCFCSPPSTMLAPYLSAGSKHVIIFHLLTDGHGYAEVEGNDRPLPLNGGDLIILPHGDPHALRNGPYIKPTDHAEQVRQVFAQGLKISRMGGGGDVSKFICGYMACDPQLSQLFLGGLPPMLKVNVRTDTSSQWLEQTIRYSVDHADRSQPGGQAVLARLSEVLFIEALRRYIAALPPEQNGWLAFVTRTSEKLWPCCIASRLILGRSPPSPKRLAFHDPRSRNGSGGISQRARCRISHGGGFLSGHNSSNPRARAFPRSPTRSAMNRNLLSTAPSNGSLVSRQHGSGVDQSQIATNQSNRY